jgi:methyl-accepting chemotaxis protein/methyl-accepting chemotaxis protein-1 (serine sensor receptor)
MRESSELTARQVQLAASLQAGFQRMRATAHAGQIAVVIGLLEKDSPMAGQCSACHGAEMIDRHNRGFQQAGDEVLAHIKQLQSLARDPEDRQRISVIHDNVVRWRSLQEDYKKGATSGKFDSAHVIAEERIFPLIERTGVIAQTAEAQARAVLDAASLRELARARRGTAITFAVVLLAVTLGAFTLWVIRRSCRQLTALVSSVAGAAAQVVASGLHIGETSQTLAKGSAGQEQALRQTASDSTEVIQLAHANTGDAARADDLVAQSAAQAAEAQQALDHMMQAMNGVHESSGQIAGILRTIDSIAFQTNILALNAAVEAARAGEAGMGFAVVAEEVRSLAHRCTGAARETAGLVEELRSRSLEGKRRVDAAVVTVQAIATGAAALRALVSQVHSSSQTQSVGMDRLGHSLNSIGQATAQAARSADEAAAESEELSRTSTDLNDAAQSLRALVG